MKRVTENTCRLSWIATSTTVNLANRIDYWKWCPHTDRMSSMIISTSTTSCVFHKHIFVYFICICVIRKKNTRMSNVSYFLRHKL